MQLFLRSLNCKYLFSSHYGGTDAGLCIRRLICSAKTTSSSSSQSFDSIMSERRRQAGNTIIVEVDNRHDIPDLCNLCQRFGPLQKVYYFRNRRQKCQVLVEFADLHASSNLLRECKTLHADGFPVWSRFLKHEPSKKLPANTSPAVDIDTVTIPSDEEVLTSLSQSSTVSDQMTNFYETERLNDLELRLGFLVCKQIEEFVSGIYPNGMVLPFGSLVNGFGRHACDIDMVYCVPPEQKGVLCFQGKQQLVNDRTLTQRVLETLGDLLHYLVPGVSQVHRILRARVPIVKFQHDITDLECDLTLNNMSGVDMSRILHFYSLLNPCIRPLMYTVRKWATASRVTEKAPGSWVTNFQLTLMVLFHLQQKGLVPSIKSFKGRSVIGGKVAGENVKEHCDDVRDSSKNAELLLSFFEFYSSFDFKSKGISPYTGNTVEKPDYSPMYIQNPLDRQLNASRNVGVSDLRKLQTCMSDALWTLQKANCKTSAGGSSWGIGAIFKPSTTRDRHMQVTQKRFQVQELFQDNQAKSSESGYVVEATVSGVKSNF
ncbi:poly(A) RNA polymerase, mitochondrial-like isoform X2 [Ornithodoros turicata]|uniref:poly(A) RNA polymerase, mitochondrial-like isoform X2 n=1 Tax=Ornithodoros turicata TaxID=34597 RepID=UPI003139AA0F